MPTTENTTATATEPTTTTASQPDVMSMAAQADAGTLPETNTATTEQPPKNDGKPAEQGSAATPAATEQQKTGTDKNEPQDTAYTKAKKEAERKDRSWKKLEEEKAELRRKQAELDERLKQASQAKPAEPAKKTGPKADDYLALAEQYEEEGKTNLANAARQKAEELRHAEKAEEAKASTQTNANPLAQPEFKGAWDKNVQELIASDPDLAKPDNPVVMTANRLCSDPQYRRFFTAHPDGIKAAVEVAKLIRDAQQVKPLQTELADLQKKYTAARAEVDRLTKATSLGGSTPATQRGEAKKVTEMSAAEAERTIRDLAAAADRGEIP